MTLPHEFECECTQCLTTARTRLRVFKTMFMDSKAYFAGLEDGMTQGERNLIRLLHGVMTGRWEASDLRFQGIPDEELELLAEILVRVKP